MILMVCSKKIIIPSVIPSGEGNENGEKTAIGLISKKATLHVQHTFFVRFFAVVLHDYNVKTSRNFPVTRFMEEMPYLFLFTLSHTLYFISRASFCHPHPQIALKLDEAGGEDK